MYNSYTFLEITVVYAVKLTSKVRRTNIQCRVGGEEFIALCRMATKGQVIEIAEIQTEKLARASIVVGDEEIHITTSMGVAAFILNGCDNSADTLNRKAAAAAYFSKKNGRYTTHHNYVLLSKNPGDGYQPCEGQ